MWKNVCMYVCMYLILIHLIVLRMRDSLDENLLIMEPLPKEKKSIRPSCAKTSRLLLKETFIQNWYLWMLSLHHALLLKRIDWQKSAGSQSSNMYILMFSTVRIDCLNDLTIKVWPGQYILILASDCYFVYLSTISIQKLLSKHHCLFIWSFQPHAVLYPALEYAVSIVYSYDLRIFHICDLHCNCRDVFHTYSNNPH